MGGSSGSTNRSNTLNSLTGGTGEGQTLSQLGNQNNDQSNQLYNLLWGSPSGSSMTPQQSFASFGGPISNAGKNAVTPTSTSGGPTLSNNIARPAGTTGSSPTSGGGALTGFLNPNNLNVSSPTGPFAAVNTNENEQADIAGQQANSATKAAASNAGFGDGAPAGFTQSQIANNNLNTANTKGNNFATNTMNAYNAASNNFWSAANAAEGGQNAAAGRAISAPTAAGSIYNNLYSTSAGLPGGGGGMNAFTQDMGMIPGALGGK